MTGQLAPNLVIFFLNQRQSLFSNTHEKSRLPLSSPFPSSFSSFRVPQLLALTYISFQYLHIFAPKVLKVKLYHSLTLPSTGKSQTLVLANIFWSFYMDRDALACISSPNILDQEAEILTGILCDSETRSRSHALRITASPSPTSVAAVFCSCHCRLWNSYFLNY